MNRFLSSKLFVALSTAVTFVLSTVFGYFMSFETLTDTRGVFSVTTATKVVFNPKTMLGYLCLSLVLAFVVFLLCVLIRKCYLSDQQK